MMAAAAARCGGCAAFVGCDLHACRCRFAMPSHPSVAFSSTRTPASPRQAILRPFLSRALLGAPPSAATARARTNLGGAACVLEGALRRLGVPHFGQLETPDGLFRLSGGVALGGAMVRREA
jgi:hypothetical protein